VRDRLPEQKFFKSLDKVVTAYDRSLMPVPVENAPQPDGGPNRP
jgi:hypothetical protein